MDRRELWTVPEIRCEDDILKDSSNETVGDLWDIIWDIFVRNQMYLLRIISGQNITPEPKESDPTTVESDAAKEDRSTQTTLSSEDDRGSSQIIYQLNGMRKDFDQLEKRVNDALSNLNVNRNNQTVDSGTTGNILPPEEERRLSIEDDRHLEGRVESLDGNQISVQFTENENNVEDSSTTESNPLSGGSDIDFEINRLAGKSNVAHPVEVESFGDGHPSEEENAEHRRDRPIAIVHPMQTVNLSEEERSSSPASSSEDVLEAQR